MHTSGSRQCLTPTQTPVDQYELKQQQQQQTTAVSPMLSHNRHFHHRSMIQHYKYHIYKGYHFNTHTIVHLKCYYKEWN